MKTYEALADKVPTDTQDFIFSAIASVKESDGIVYAELKSDTKEIIKSMKKIEGIQIQIEHNQDQHNKADDARFGAIGGDVKTIKDMIAPMVEEYQRHQENMRVATRVGDVVKNAGKWIAVIAGIIVGWKLLKVYIIAFARYTFL